MIFDDRIDAGRQLAHLLMAYRGRHAVVLALPRGGVPVAAEVARAIGADLDLLIVRKLGLPFEPELAMGAVVDARVPIVVRNEDVIRAAGVSAADFERVLAAERIELTRRREKYFGTRAHPDLKGRVVLVVDDGLATGATMRAALTAVRRQSPAQLVAAVPVGAKDSLAEIASLADRVVCVEAPSSLGSIGAYYRNFDQLGDADVLAVISNSAAPPPVR